MKESNKKKRRSYPLNLFSKVFPCNTNARKRKKNAIPSNTSKSTKIPKEPNTLESPRPTFIISMKYVSGEI